MPEFWCFAMKNFIFALCLLLIVALPARQAVASEALVPSEVDVDVPGKDAADARAQAMAKGEVNALIDLLGKLTSPQQAQAIIDGLDANKVSSMVRGTEVMNEKIASNRYRAHLKVTFDGDEISALVGKI